MSQAVKPEVSMEGDRCTWDGCTKAATVPQIARDGERWANLCAEHDAELNKAIDTSNVPALMRGWVKAQGGAKKAAARMTGGGT